jgi:uncharacterized membrane protein
VDEHVHWVAEIAGKKKEWDAEITRQVPDSEIDWIGLGEADNRGRLVFEPTDRGTKVTMMLDYDPEGAVEEIGDKLGIVRRRVDGDMERFKEFLEARGRETGELTVLDGLVPRSRFPVSRRGADRNSVRVCPRGSLGIQMAAKRS